MKYNVKLNLNMKSALINSCEGLKYKILVVLNMQYTQLTFNEHNILDPDL